jgi:hypothetical protein
MKQVLHTGAWLDECRNPPTDAARRSMRRMFVLNPAEPRPAEKHGGNAEGVRGAISGGASGALRGLSPQTLQGCQQIHLKRELPLMPHELGSSPSG